MREGLCQNESFVAAPLRCARIDKKRPPGQQNSEETGKNLQLGSRILAAILS